MRRAWGHGELGLPGIKSGRGALVSLCLGKEEVEEVVIQLGI